MRKLTFLTAVILTLALPAQAATVTGADIRNPFFAWNGLALKVDLFTEDPAEVDYASESGGKTVMLRLKAPEGAPMDAVQAGLNALRLRDASGEERIPAAWRVNGDAGGLLTGFDLIYELPAGTPSGGASLVAGDPSAGSRTVLPLSAGAAEGAEAAQPSVPPETGAQPASSPGPAAEGDSLPLQTALIRTLLASAVAEASDPWAKAILSSGPRDIAYENGVVRFTLRAFDPRLDELGDYGADRAAYLSKLLENAARHNLNCALPVTPVAGTYGADGEDVKALSKSVEKAAAIARKAFDDPRVRVALADLILGDGAAARYGRGRAEAVAPLFAARFRQRLNVSEGPFALRLTATVADGAALAESAYRAALSRLKARADAEAMENREIEDLFVKQLSERAASLKAGDAAPRVFALNLDELPASPGADYEAYLTEYLGAYDARLADLVLAARG